MFATDPESRLRAHRLARARLRSAMVQESRRRRFRQRARRGVVISMTTVLVMGIAPTGLDGTASPLIGLADAIAVTPILREPVGRHWYARSESRELVSIPASGAGHAALQFLITAVSETWHDAGDGPRRTVTYGSPQFFSAEDEDRFHSTGLATRYASGRAIEVPVAQDFARFVATISEAEPADLAGALRRRVAGLGDRRMEEVRILQLTAELIQAHADDASMRSRILRVIADIPGIMVVANARNMVVSIDYVDGDRPLRLMYEFDGDTAHLVGEYLAALATQSEPASVIRSARHSIPTTPGVSES